MVAMTIGFVPRERFAVSPRCLEQLLANTDIPFDLIVVDCGIPTKYRAQLDLLLRRRPNVDVIATGDYCLPNRARNLVIQQCRTEYLCLIENDVLVEEHWLDRLVDACESGNGDVAAPLIIEGEGDGGVHFDWRLDRVVEHKSGEESILEILPKEDWSEYTSGTLSRRRVDFVEQHCLLLRRRAATLAGLFDEDVNTRMEVDMSLKLRQNGQTILFEPLSKVHFLSPDRIEPDERPYFEFRWNLDTARFSHDKIDSRWSLANLPTSMPFVRSRLRLAAMSGS